MVQNIATTPQSVRTPADNSVGGGLPKGPFNSRRAVLAYIDRVDKVKRQRGDIDEILLGQISHHSPLERGIVGPTGASSIVNASVLGPLFATWGAVAGYRIITGARDASAYLRLISIEIEKLEGELKALQSDAGSVAAPRQRWSDSPAAEGACGLSQRRGTRSGRAALQSNCARLHSARRLHRHHGGGHQ